MGSDVNGHYVHPPSKVFDKSHELASYVLAFRLYRSELEASFDLLRGKYLYVFILTAVSSFWSLFISMASSVPSVLVLGHSFIRRLRDDLRSHFDSRADDTLACERQTFLLAHRR